MRRLWLFDFRHYHLFQSFTLISLMLGRHHHAIAADTMQARHPLTDYSNELALLI